MPMKMMAITKHTIVLAMGAATLAIVGAGAAAADGYPVPPAPQGQYQAPPPDYRAPPPVQRDYGHPPPPVTYGYPAPPPVAYYEYPDPQVVVVPRPYPYYVGRYYGPVYDRPFWGRAPFWRGPFVARGYGWGHFHRW